MKKGACSKEKIKKEDGNNNFVSDIIGEIKKSMDIRIRERID